MRTNVPVCHEAASDQQSKDMTDAYWDSTALKVPMAELADSVQYVRSKKSKAVEQRRSRMGEAKASASAAAEAKPAKLAKTTSSGPSRTAAGGGEGETDEDQMLVDGMPAPFDGSKKQILQIRIEEPTFAKVTSKVLTTDLLAIRKRGSPQVRPGAGSTRVPVACSKQMPFRSRRNGELTVF